MQKCEDHIINLTSKVGFVFLLHLPSIDFYLFYFKQDYEVDLMEKCPASLVIYGKHRATDVVQCIVQKVSCLAWSFVF